MNKQKIGTVTFLFLICCIVNLPVIADSAITFTDALGREISLDRPAERVGFQFYGVGEALKIIDAWDLVVARDGYISDEQFFPGYKSIPAINPESGEMELNYEKIIEISPDVMIIQNEFWYADAVKDAINSLEPEITVVVLDFVDPFTMTENFEKLGVLTGNKEKAKEFSDYYNSIISPIRDELSNMAESEKPQVFMKAAGYSRDQLCTYGSEMKGWNNLLNIAGGRNAASDLSFAFGDVDPEWLINTDYDVLIDEIWDVYYPESFDYAATNPAHARVVAEGLRDQIMQNEIFSGSTAVKNKRVYLADHALFGTVRQVVLIPYLAKWIHPELFGHLDPETIHQEYLNRFIRAGYNLKEVGIFTYP